MAGSPPDSGVLSVSGIQSALVSSLAQDSGSSLAQCQALWERVCARKGGWTGEKGLSDQRGLAARLQVAACLTGAKHSVCGIQMYLGQGQLHHRVSPRAKGKWGPLIQNDWEFQQGDIGCGILSEKPYVTA